MKKLFKPLFAVIFLIGILHNPVVAQTTSNDMATSPDMNRHDDSGKWGLLGLLGLLGLIRMKKAEKTGTYSTTNNPRNS